MNGVLRFDFFGIGYCAVVRLSVSLYATVYRVGIAVLFCYSCMTR